LAINWISYQAEVANLAATDPTDPTFSSILGAMVDYAEQRCYRDLNLLATRVVDDTGVATAGSKQFTLPSSKGTFMTVTDIYVITPANSTIASGGSRQSLASVPMDLNNYLAPSETATATSVPQYFSMLTDQKIVLGPPPSDNFAMEVVGTIRPTPISNTNSESFLTRFLPDLFIAASMVFYSGFMRNFGSQSDDPKMAVSWSQQYDQLLVSAKTEETRRRYNLTMGGAP
jgi:hypothetical protein